MNNIFQSLNEQELDRLDQFLINRIDDDDDSDDGDEGVLDISELDGFLTAIVSGPVMVPPSQWLPAVWGDFEPEWDNEKDFNEIMSLFMRHMNGIAGTLLESPEKFEPLFLQREVKGKTYDIVDEWCYGYMRGVALAMDEWDKGGHEMMALLMPIMAFASEQGWDELDNMSEDEVDNIRNAITPNVREIHAYWLARRENSGPSHSPVRNTEPRVGRNDPCPCGSGKKYKKCCLH
ncbi:MAG: UPF0149 family protein [Gammaproteobacteria bacterium]|jgi:uncharacterized protein